MTENYSPDGEFESLLGDLLDESVQLLDRLHEALAELGRIAHVPPENREPACQLNLLNETFRAAHSLKGLSGMMGLSDINHLTHEMENVFDAARKNEIVLDPATVDLLVNSTDKLSDMVSLLQSGSRDVVDCSDVLTGIHDVLVTSGRIQELASTDLIDQILAQSNRHDASTTDESAEALAEVPEETPQSSQEPAAEQPGGPQESELIAAFATIVDEANVPAKYLSIFIDEAEMSLDSLTESLLTEEGSRGREATEKLMIVSHRIKGSAACVGLHRPAKLAHVMEDLLQRLRDENAQLTHELTDALLKCVDGLKNYVEELKAGRPSADSFPKLAYDLLAAQNPRTDSPAKAPPGISPVEKPKTTAPEPAKPVASSDLPPEIRAAMMAKMPPAGHGWLIQIVLQTGIPLSGLKARLIYEKLCQVGHVVYCHPSCESLDDIDELAELFVALITDQSREQVQALVNVSGVQRANLHLFDRPLVVSESTVTPGSVKHPVVEAPRPASGMAKQPPAAPPLEIEKPVPTAAETAKPADTVKPTETLRVDIERLDHLMNLTGQLVINRARFSQIGESLKQSSSIPYDSRQFDNMLHMLERMSQGHAGPGASAEPPREIVEFRGDALKLRDSLERMQHALEQFSKIKGNVSELFEAIHQLNLVSDGIQKSVMDTRMVPIGPLFTRFRRVVRDITRANGKEVALVIHGEKTELDKRMIDELSDPLIHMIRNSVDHGIESPADRVAAGKPRQGTITLDARHRGNSILIRVMDDGKGLNVDRIRSKAIERGLITAADAERMTPQQICQLIWEPGFSTAEKVTEISGRGMGMDIVRSKIEGISGTVELENKPGQGTTFTIRLPLTLAILPSLMANIRGEIYALPLESVQEIVRVGTSDIYSIHGTPMARIRGRVVSIVELHEILHWNSSPADGDLDDAPEKTLVVIGTDDREVGLVVDQLLGEEDIVIKSMAENYRNIEGVAGASILGDGRVSLILDVGILIDLCIRNASNTKRKQEVMA